MSLGRRCADDGIIAYKAGKAELSGVFFFAVVVGPLFPGSRGNIASVTSTLRISFGRALPLLLASMNMSFIDSPARVTPSNE